MLIFTYVLCVHLSMYYSWGIGEAWFAKSLGYWYIWFCIFCDPHEKMVFDGKLQASATEPNDFKNFSTKPLNELLNKANTIFDTSGTPP